MGFALTAVYLGIDYIDWPAARRDWSVADRVAFTKRQLPAVAGFGTGVWALLFIPVVNLFFMPAAVAGGTMLFVALGVGALVQRASGEQVRTSLAGSARTIVPVAAALIAMLGLARIMVHSGMVDAIAVAAADSVGSAWPLFAPAVGALGTFVTGSATASNALFSDLQIVTATQVGDSVAVTLGAQGFGAAADHHGHLFGLNQIAGITDGGGPR